MQRGRKSKNMRRFHGNDVNLQELFEDSYKELLSNSLARTSADKLTNLRKLSEHLLLPVEQVLILVVLVVRFETTVNVYEHEVINLLKSVFGLSVRELRNNLRELKKMGLVNSVAEGRSTLWYPVRKVIDAIDKDAVHFFSSLRPKGIEKMLEFWSNTVLDNLYVSSEEIEETIEVCIEINPRLKLIKYLDKHFDYGATLEAACLLCICSQGLLHSKPFKLEILERKAFFSRFHVAVLRDSINEGYWKPISDGYVQLAGGRTTRSDTRLELTEKGFNYFMDEIDINVLKLIKKKLCHADISLLKPVDISDANLFYQEDFMEELVKIEQILSEKNFNRYISRFSKTSRMKGLTFLFYGSPGCGKTEFALQLAKRTQRPILKIQVTDFMSKWVGESEANLKRIFNDYRMLVEQSKIQPILLLNECDQMIGKRVNISDSVDQMSNALQNILLEEMENFSGILIGTTNQTANMDSAFERRWLYKLEFIPPNEKIQVKIWQSFLPRLPENIALELSSRFNLTPGEISNVAKRFEIEQLIVKKSAVLETLLRLCGNETFANKVGQSIGFHK
jgi:hypothetical protein